MHWGLKMKQVKNDADTALEALFEAERASPPAVPDALMQRVLADATAVQPAGISGRTSGLLARFLVRFGGIAGAGGLITATAVGFWLGLAPPDGMPDLAGVVMGYEESVFLVELTDVDSVGFGWDFEEGDADG